MTRKGHVPLTFICFFWDDSACLLCFACFGDGWDGPSSVAGAELSRESDRPCCPVFIHASFAFLASPQSMEAGHGPKKTGVDDLLFLLGTWRWLEREKKKGGGEV